MASRCRCSICLFRSNESVNHFLPHADPDLCRQLPHIYAVCIADNSAAMRGIPAGFFVKTSYTHADPGFHDALNGVTRMAFDSELLSTWQASFLPARLGLPDDAPMTEQEMLRVIVQQRLKHTGAYRV